MSDIFDANEITRLLSVLIGSVEPTAESHIDSVRFENCEIMIDICDWMISQLCNAAFYANSPYYSAQKIGQRAYSALTEWGSWIVDVKGSLQKTGDEEG